MAWFKTCIRCGAEQIRCGTWLFCIECSYERKREAVRAIAKVLKAIKLGKLAKATDCTCVDCGKPARQYDHRDYLNPLDVVPVCVSCNQKRGPAFDSVYRPSCEPA
jgi:hypothetical protein